MCKPGVNKDAVFNQLFIVSNQYNSESLRDIHSHSRG